MRDIADIANEQVEAFTRAALSHRKPVLLPVGRCYNCDEKISGVYCDADCRDDHELRQRAERQNRKS